MGKIDSSKGRCVLRQTEGYINPPFFYLNGTTGSSPTYSQKKQFFSPISQILPWSYETSNRGIINWGDLTIMKALS